ncbi:MAG: DUF3866 family protein [Vulcanibacillus sp.]
MISLDNAKVLRILDQTEKVQKVLVKNSNGESEAINYLDFNNLLNIGDQVIINCTATTLSLGTGGYDFVVSSINPNINLSNFDKNSDGHIMKLKYTPYQFSVKSCEEESSEYHNIFKEIKTLDNLPVLIGELHSMLPILVTTIRQLEIKEKLKRKRIIYIMTDGGALPIELSEHVRRLKGLGWLDGSITIGNAFGGDLEAVNIYSGLIAAKHILDADIIIVLMGPGIVGTNTLIGNTAIEQGIISNAVRTLKGMPICILRASIQDERDRHNGISHHSLTVLNQICLSKNIVTYPKYIVNNLPKIYDTISQIDSIHQLEEVNIINQELIDFLKEYPYPITTMNRTINDDYLFFDFVASSAYWVVEQVNKFK